MDDWNIQARKHSCSQCGILFVEKSPCYTVLMNSPSGYQRQDLCRACWEASGGAMIRERLGVISHWKSVYKPPASPPLDPLPKEDAESLLRRMLKQDDPSEVEVRYILAVMLERKRILKHRETQGATNKILIYEHLKTGEVFMVMDPELRLDQLSDVQKRVTAMLQPSGSAPAQAHPRVTV